MDAVKISTGKLEMLRLLLKDPKIKSCIIVDGSYAGEIEIKENGDILLGRTKFGWVNRLFNSYKEIDFFSMASKIAVVITGSVKESNSEMVGIMDEIINKTLITNNREQVIDLLFQYVVLFDKDSIYASKFIRGDTLKPRILDSIPLGTIGIDIGGTTLNVPFSLDKIK